MEAVQVAHRCSAEDGCDEATIKRYVVTNHEGQAAVCEYCDDCAELAAADWNGETAAIVAAPAE